MNHISKFDFDLPKHLIASSPAQIRDQSRLMVVDNQLSTQKFADIIDYLNAGDLLILNNSKVIKAKIILPNNVRIHLHEEKSEFVWIGYAKPAKKLKAYDVFYFDNHKVTIKNKFEFGKIEIEFDLDKIAVVDFLEIYGYMPLPPYIKREANDDKVDNERYQTVFAEYNGSVAAPTAGLHFSQNLLDRIIAKGVEIDFVTLHVGAGTFAPIKTEDIDSHEMHYEEVCVSEVLIKKIKQTKLAGKNVIAVGTTVLRALESAFLWNRVGIFRTNIFIKSGFKFQSANMLITNFHLPKSTLLILVSEFAGYGIIKDAYAYAIQNKYKFFSYGDAMLLYRRNK